MRVESGGYKISRIGSHLEDGKLRNSSFVFFWYLIVSCVNKGRLFCFWPVIFESLRVFLAKKWLLLRLPPYYYCSVRLFL